VVAHHHPDSSHARPGRRHLRARNALWTAWLRRRARAAIATTARAGLGALRRGEPAALVSALRGLPWIVRERRPVPRDVERAARRLGLSLPIE